MNTYRLKQNNLLYAFVFAIIISFTACNNQSNDSSAKTEFILSVNNSFDSKSEVEKTSFLTFNNEKVFVKLDYKNDREIEGKTSKGTTLFSKKRFKLTSLNDLNKAKEFNKINQLLKSQRLIGIYSEVVQINNKHYLFQEGFDKRIAESNKRRDGILFSLTNSTVKILHKGTIENVDSLKNSLKESLLNNEKFACFFDKNKTIKFNKIIDNYEIKGFGNICYYLNPVSNLIEPFVYLEGKADNSFFYKLLGEITNELSCNESKIDNYFSISNDTIIPNNINLTISYPVTIPKGYQLYIPKGTSINFTNGGFICSYSPVNMHGNAADSIMITSSDKTGKGFHVFNCNKNSTIQYASFRNINNLNHNGWTLPSAVTFYESDVTIKNCSFGNNNCEDALNIFRSSYTLSNSEIKNTFSDAFDADFSDGIITNCKFFNSGNDGIDISGSKLTLKNSVFYNIADKALSAGEDSQMQIDSIEINKCAMAIVSKDLSRVVINYAKVDSSDVVYSAFQKKKEFGPSSIIANKVAASNFKENALIEVNSSLMIENQEYIGHRTDVKTILYGNEYGKATVK